MAQLQTGRGVMEDNDATSRVILLQRDVIIAMQVEIAEYGQETGSDIVLRAVLDALGSYLNVYFMEVEEVFHPDQNL